MMNSSLGDMQEKRVNLLDILSAHVTAPGRKACPPRTAGRKLIWGGITSLLLLLSLSACQASPATLTQHNTPLAVTTISATDVPVSAVPTAPATHTSTSTPNPSISNATPIPTLPACWKAGGRVEKAALELETLPQPLQFRVYLPPCYDELPAEHYPVLYLIHGQSFNDDQWERLGAPELVDRLSAKGELPPFIIVMPRDRVWSEPTEDQFGQAVIDALVPYIDASYRTRPERNSRAIGGLSRGGAWALHLGLSHWEIFGAIGMHSGFSFHSDAGWMPFQWRKCRVFTLISARMTSMTLLNLPPGSRSCLRNVPSPMSGTYTLAIMRRTTGAHTWNSICAGMQKNGSSFSCHSSNFRLNSDNRQTLLRI
jgi:enterochelin esterase-like enzyme